jgi:AraC-like DNA-binding protein
MNLGPSTKRSKKPGKSSAFQQLLPAAAAEALQRIREDRGRVQDPVKSMLAHIEEHLFDGDLNVQSLKHHCGIRDHAVTVRFSAALGVLPGGYIEDRRMETAGRLLVDTDLRVWQIAELVGYSGIQVFSRAFERWFRVRPTVYRREQRKRLPAPPPDPAAQKPRTPLPEPMLREIPITEMWHQLSSLPDQLTAQPGAVAVTREGEPVLAVMSWELFGSLLEIIAD